MASFLSRHVALYVYLLLIACSVSVSVQAKYDGEASATECVIDERRTTTDLPDYLIVGAGGSGLQLSLFLQKYNYSYTILEKEDVAGSFWTHFPAFDKLISVNKWTRNEKERLRYDWHSMLEAPLQMFNVTEDYFPEGKDWHRYMTRVVEMAGINIEYGVEVEHVAKDKPCITAADGTERCAKRRIFVGTGLKEKEEPMLRALGGIPYSRVTKDMGRHRRVCILGNGNSGFEVAQNLFDVADRVTLYGKHAHRLSSVTRYTGDVRVKYLQALENLNGKLLDTVDSFADIPMPLTQGLERVLNATQIEVVRGLLQTAAWLKQFDCEVFVITTGFRSHVPGGLSLDDSTFPPMTDWYRSTENPSVHYIGWLMHKYDFRKGAGGFLSGYRYLIRNLVHHVREVDCGIPYPYEVLTKQQVIAKVISRVQVADDLIILQDGVVLRDIIIPSPEEKDMFHYFEAVTYKFHKDFVGSDNAIAVYFAWGDGRTRTASHVFDGIYRFSDSKRLINIFLHPVVEIRGLTSHVLEDLEMTWADAPYVSTVEKTIRAALNGDLSSFSKKEQHSYARAEYNQTKHGEYNYYQATDLKASVDKEVIQALWKAVYTNGRPREMQSVREAMTRWMPALFDHKLASDGSFQEVGVASTQ